MAVLTPTDRPKSVRNRCVIDFLVAFCVVSWLLNFSVGKVAFVIGLNQISFFFSLSLENFDPFEKFNLGRIYLN